MRTDLVVLNDDVRTELVTELSKALRSVGAGLDLQVIFDGWGDFLTTEDVVHALKAWNSKHRPGGYGEISGEPLRTIHHFACTGGTVISKAIASLSGVILLNEIDPLGRHHFKGLRHKPFFPTDIVGELHYARATVDETIEVFNAALVSLRNIAARRGRSVVLRDHAHSHFCTAADIWSRPTTKEIVSRALPVLSVVTVRHPIDSFLSLEAAKWRHFEPFTLDEYCSRYIAFMESQRGTDVYRYEDFVRDPNATLQQIAASLGLRFERVTAERIADVSLGGDSGRKGNEITARPRREVSTDIITQAEQSEKYKQLCAWLGYDAFPLTEEDSQPSMLPTPPVENSAAT